MADENPTPEAQDNTDEALRPEGLRALQAERERVKALSAQLKELADWKAEQEQAGKSETEKLAAEVARLKAEHDKASRDSLRLRVAMQKGLTEKQAARLVGDDEAALLADADDLLGSFKSATEGEEPAGGPSLNSRPVENLKGGARPAEPGLEFDPAKLAAEIAAISQ